MTVWKVFDKKVLLCSGPLNPLTTWGQPWSTSTYSVWCTYIIYNKCVLNVCCSLKLYKTPLCVSLNADPFEFSEVCLRDPDRRRGRWSRQDPVRDFCQTLHLPGPHRWGPIRRFRRQLPQRYATTGVSTVFASTQCVHPLQCVCFMCWKSSQHHTHYSLFFTHLFICPFIHLKDPGEMTDQVLRRSSIQYSDLNVYLQTCKFYHTTHIWSISLSIPPLLWILRKMAPKIRR